MAALCADTNIERLNTSTYVEAEDGGSYVHPAAWIKQGCLSPQQLQGRTAYSPRVCADKGRARCRRDIGPTSLRKPPPRTFLKQPPRPRQPGSIKIIIEHSQLHWPPGLGRVHEAPFAGVDRDV